MALSTKVGQLSQPASTGNQAVTGVGFQPKAVIFWAQNLTADGSSADSSGVFGFATSSSSRRSVYGFTPDLSSSQYAGHDSSLCIVFLNSVPSAIASADFVSMDADGFTINWTVADANARKINYLCLGGTDISNATTGVFQEAGATGTQAVTGVGFQPDVLLIPSWRKTATAPPSNANSANRPGFGAAGSSSNQGFSGGSNQNTGAAQFGKTYQRTIDIEASINATVGPAIESEGAFSSMDSDGFTINWTTISASRYIHFLALKGIRIKVGVFNQATGTGNQATTGVGFQPDVIILFSNNVASSSSIQASNRFSFGVGRTSSERFSTWTGNADGGTVSTSDQNLDSANVIKMMTEALLGAPTTQAVADLVSLDSDGFTLNWTTADATARQVMYIALASAAAATPVTIAGARMLSMLGVGR